MDLITVRELYKHPEGCLGKKINVGDWACGLRDSRAFGFIVASDESFFETLQIVYHGVLPNFAEASRSSVGTAIFVKGTLVSTPQVRQPFEVQAVEITVEGTSSPDYPLQKKCHFLEFLRTISYPRPRANTFQAVFRARSLTVYAIHQYFQEKDSVCVCTSLIAGNGCEGAGEMFQVATVDLDNISKAEDGKVDFSQDFFGKATSPIVNGQLSTETYAMAFRNVYTFDPAFRVENSNTTRHATELWMTEPETAFVDLDGNIYLTEDTLKHIIQFALERALEEMNLFNQFANKGLLDRLHNILNSEFSRTTYTGAVKILEEHNDEFDYKVSWGCDLQTERERYLTEQVLKKSVFVTDYPKEIKAFYMKANPDNETVAVVDCLVPGIGEVIDGSQREDDYDRLATRMGELGLKRENYDFYPDLKKYGSTRHAGFGPDFERCVMYPIGMSNIHDVIPLPRTVNNCEL